MSPVQIIQNYSLSAQVTFHVSCTDQIELQSLHLGYIPRLLYRLYRIIVSPLKLHSTSPVQIIQNYSLSTQVIFHVSCTDYIELQSLLLGCIPRLLYRLYRIIVSPLRLHSTSPVQIIQIYSLSSQVTFHVSCTDYIELQSLHLGYIPRLLYRLYRLIVSPLRLHSTSPVQIIQNYSLSSQVTFYVSCTDYIELQSLLLGYIPRLLYRLYRIIVSPLRLHSTSPVQIIQNYSLSTQVTFHVSCTDYIELQSLHLGYIPRLLHRLYRIIVFPLRLHSTSPVQIIQNYSLSTQVTFHVFCTDYIELQSLHLGYIPRLLYRLYRIIVYLLRLHSTSPEQIIQNYSLSPQVTFHVSCTDYIELQSLHLGYIPSLLYILYRIIVSPLRLHSTSPVQIIQNYSLSTQVTFHVSCTDYIELQSLHLGYIPRLLYRLYRIIISPLRLHSMSPVQIIQNYSRSTQVTFHVSCTDYIELQSLHLGYIPRLLYILYRIIVSPLRLHSTSPVQIIQNYSLSPQVTFHVFCTDSSFHTQF